jgi:hypothetical protein
VYSYLKTVTIILLFFSLTFAIWVPDLNSLELPTYTTISKSGIIDYAFWVGLKLGLDARENGQFVIKLPLIDLSDNSFSKSVFLQLNYSNSFIKGVHSAGITVVASVVEYNSYLVSNMNYDFLSGKYTKLDLKARMEQYSKIPVSESKSLDSLIDKYIYEIYLRSIRKMKLTTLPYDKVKVIGKHSLSWSDASAKKTMTISGTPIKCDTIFIIGNATIDSSVYENVFRIFQYNKKMEEIIKKIIFNDLSEKINF